MRDSQWLRLGVLFVLLSVVAAGPSRGQQSAPPRPAVAIEPIKAILDAFRSHSIVALSEGTTHGDEQSTRFGWRSFAIHGSRHRHDIVVESGNALYQDVIDRFVRGDEVPYDSLRAGVAEHDTAAHRVGCADLRGVLSSGSGGERGPSPRNGSSACCSGTLQSTGSAFTPGRCSGLWANPLFDRDRYPADLIRREVLAKQRRALVVYGANAPPAAEPVIQL